MVEHQKYTTGHDFVLSAIQVSGWVGRELLYDFMTIIFDMIIMITWV